MGRPICILNDYQPTQCGGKFGLQQPVLHLKCDDNRASPKVYDELEIYNQVFLDPTGNPNTNAHSVAGVHDLALSFDGVDDCIDLSEESQVQYLGEGTDFTIAFWWKANSPNPAAALHFLSNYIATDHGIAFSTNANTYRISVRVRWPLGFHDIFYNWGVAIDASWYHFALVREANTISAYQDAVLAVTDTDAHNYLALGSASRPLGIAHQGGSTRFSPGACDDFRLYTRALSQTEITELATP